jgi:glutamate-1-semialdehyde 2,1-aminomutase
VQSAIRIARAYTGRDKLIKFEGHYHGWFNNVLVSYHPSASEDSFKPIPACGGQPAQEYAETIVLPWNHVEALEQAFERYPSQIACLVMEPILANSGCCMPREHYLERVIQLCHQYGAVSIFDEVITGFRLALGGARQYFGLTPDLSVYAKAMANGFAISSVGGRRELFDVLRDGRTIHAGTYNGNPVNMAAAIATVKFLSAAGTYERMEAHGQSIRRALQDSASSMGLALVTCGTGTVFSVHFGVKAEPRDYRDTLRSDMGTYTRFRVAMLQNGIQLLPDGRWYIGASHGEKELAKTLQGIERSMAFLIQNS